MLKLLIMGVLANAAMVAPGGVVTSVGYGVTEIEACTQAKNDAKGVATLDGTRYGSIANLRITGFSACRCQSGLQQNGESTPTRHYSCSVDATYTQ